jgi:hypothetical protein
VAAYGPGSPPHVKVFTQNKALIGNFTAYSAAFKGGVDVAVGDVDGDGTDEIVTAPGRGGGPHIKVFSLSGVVSNEFMADSPSDLRGIRLSTGDIDGDGVDEIVTTKASGTLQSVKIFTASGALVNNFPVYSGFDGSVDVAVGDVDGDGTDEIVTAPGKGGGPHIIVFSSSGSISKEFMAYETTFRGGVSISVGKGLLSNTGEEIATVPATSGYPQYKLFNATGQKLNEKFYMEKWWKGSVNDISVGNNDIRASAAKNRRSTIRPVL